MTKLSQIHRAVEDDTRKLGETEDIWPTDGYQLNPARNTYDISFQDALESIGSKTISGFLEKRKMSGLNTFCLDLMGSAIYPKASDYIDGMIGVRLKENDDVFMDNAKIVYYNAIDDIEKSFRHKNRRVIEADVYTKKTFDKVRETMKDMGIPSFDMITCRPAGPFKALRLDRLGIIEEEALPEYYALQLKRYTRLLNDHGIMLVQIPQSRLLYTRLDEIGRVFKDDGLSFRIFESDYPRESKVLLVKKDNSKNTHNH